LVGSDSWGCVSQIGLQIPLPERYYLAFATFEGQEAVAEYLRQPFLFRILKYEQFWLELFTTNIGNCLFSSLKQAMRKIIFGTILLISGTVNAQSVDSLLNLFNDTASVRRSEISSQAPLVMDLKWNQIRTKWININIGAAILLDHNIVNQDADNVTQVGEISPGTEFRGDRLMASGTINFKNPWRYMFSINWNGLDAPQGKKSVDFIDWNVEIPIGKTAGWITVGKQKEGVGLEYVAPGTQGLFMERGTGAPMFIRQRNIGIRYSNSVLGQRMTYTVGFFNNYWETGKSFSDNGTQITARVTGLARYVSDRDLVHVGVGFRHTGPTEGNLSYKAKPEVNTAPSFISTGSFQASAASLWMFEGIYVKGPVMAIGEYYTAGVNSESKGNPSFSYWQLGAGWFITGENRKYNRLNGNPGKLIPKRNFKFRKGVGPGAWELASRFTRTDGTDAGISGGEFNRITMGVSWFPNAHFRYTINYGHGWLNKGGLQGQVNIWQFRVQFEL
jgi:phosphate-selective porin